jgi:hypothetical protein
MPATYTLIASTTADGTTSSVSFTSIPQTYTDLVVRLTARNTGTNVDNSLAVRPNGSTTNDSNTRLSGNGSTASSGRSTADFDAGRITSGNATADTFGSVEMYIPNYTAATNKPMSAFGVAETNATAVEMRINALLWSNTSAITSLNITTDGVGNFASGSSFFLYGIKNS